MSHGLSPTPALNGKELTEHFIYEGEVCPASAPLQTMDDEENLVQVDRVAQNPCEKEEESLAIPA